MNERLLHSALRELRVFAMSKRFWLTFAAVVLIFAFTGPFGTAETMGFLPRFAFWLLLHGVAWSLAVLCVVLANLFLVRAIASRLARMCLGAVFAALPIGAAVELILWSWNGETPSWPGLGRQVISSLPLSLVFCLLSYMAMNGEQAAAPAGEPTSPTPPRPDVPLMKRLKPENRGAVLHVTVEDHYTAVTTSRGRELILLRFSDALNELGQTDGLQVHRSHWVAKAEVDGLVRDNGKLALRLKDGVQVPVSRTYAAEVRAAFGPLG